MNESRRKAKIEFLKSLILSPGNKYPNGRTYIDEDGHEQNVSDELESAGMVDSSGSYKWVPSDELKSAIEVAIINTIIDELEEWGLYK